MSSFSTGLTVYLPSKSFSGAMLLKRSNREGRKTQAVNSITKKGIMDKAKDPTEQIKPTAAGEQGDQKGGREERGGQQGGGQQGGGREERGGQQGGGQPGGGQQGGGQQGGGQQGGGREKRGGQQSR
jgi:hypothetical protein